MFRTLRNAWKITDLRKKILYTLFIILIFRIGSAIPVPFVDIAELTDQVKSQSSTVMSYLTLLSGGERALTAIAILFAILKCRPMPFCILDEIEAALDEANVDRFASYLKRFAQETQFIVITHRRPTMNQSDALFGVTMQEKGVSKIVSVKLGEVEKELGEGTVE